MAKRTGLGRGIGALIPTSEPSAARPVDVFFPNSKSAQESADVSDAHDDPASTPVDGAAKPAGAQPTHAESAPGQPARAQEDRADAASGQADSGTGLVAVPGARLVEIDPRTIVPNPRQPRTVFDEDDLAELVHSVREFGVLQPVVVRLREDGVYELIMGERRTRAAREAGLASIPAIVREVADEDLLRDALLENLHRAELNPLEEASAYQQLLEDFGITQEALAQRLGRSRPQISNTIRLLRLPVPVQQRVAAGVLSAGHARAILSLAEPEAMQRLADKIVNEDLSVRAAEAAARTIVTPKRAAPKAGGRRGHLDDLAERLGDRLDTRVRIALGAKRGQIVIDFATVQDLNRILAELGEDALGR